MFTGDDNNNSSESRERKNAYEKQQSTAVSVGGELKAKPNDDWFKILTHLLNKTREK